MLQGVTQFLYFSELHCGQRNKPFSFTSVGPSHFPNSFFALLFQYPIEPQHHEEYIQYRTLLQFAVKL